jgi:hypothetical protein
VTVNCAKSGKPALPSAFAEERLRPGAARAGQPVYRCLAACEPSAYRPGVSFP